MKKFLTESMTTKPLMIRKDGKVYEVEYHPYASFSTPEVEPELTLDVCEWLFNHTQNNSTKKAIIDFLSLYCVVEELSLQELIDELDAQMSDKFINNISVYMTEDVDGDLQTKAENVSDCLNDEFLRARYTGRYDAGTSKEMIFRVASNHFNWFDIIYEYVLKNKNDIESVTIVKDLEATGSDTFYAHKGKEFYKMPIDEFLTLSGNPIVESKKNKKKKELNYFFPDPEKSMKYFNKLMGNNETIISNEVEGNTETSFDGVSLAEAEKPTYTFSYSGPVYRFGKYIEDLFKPVYTTAQNIDQAYALLTGKIKPLYGLNRTANLSIDKKLIKQHKQEEPKQEEDAELIDTVNNQDIYRKDNYFIIDGIDREFATKSDAIDYILEIDTMNESKIFDEKNIVNHFLNESNLTAEERNNLVRKVNTAKSKDDLIRQLLSDDKKEIKKNESATVISKYVEPPRIQEEAINEGIDSQIYDRFEDIVDYVFGMGIDNPEEEIERRVKILYNQHKGNKDWDDTYEVWLNAQKDLEEALILDEELSASDLDDIGIELDRLCDQKHLWADYIKYEDDKYPLNIKGLVFEVSGDWRHDHLYFNDLAQALLKAKGYEVIRIDTEEIGESEEDSYDAFHTIIFTDNSEDVDKYNEIKKLFDESLKEGMSDIQNDFRYARRNWDKLGFNISLDDALEAYNKEFGEENFFAKPLYSEEAWNKMVDMFRPKNEALNESSDAYSYEEIEKILKDLTKDFTKQEGTVRSYFEEEKNFAKQILTKYYDYVDVSDGRHSNDEEMSWAIAYAKPSLKEDLSTFNTRIKNLPQEKLNKIIEVQKTMKTTDWEEDPEANFYEKKFKDEIDKYNIKRYGFTW